MFPAETQNDIDLADDKSDTSRVSDESVQKAGSFLKLGRKTQIGLHQNLKLLFFERHCSRATDWGEIFAEHISDKMLIWNIERAIKTQ